MPLSSRQRFSRPDAHSATISTNGMTHVRFVADSRPVQQGSAKLEEAKRQLIKLTEEVVGEFTTTGDTYYANYQFEKALEAYKEGLGYVEKQDLPTLWATMQWISGMANSEIGVRTGSELLQQYLKEAVNAYREAQTVYTKREFPKAWAALENNLGNVLQNQGTRTGGEKGTKLLAEAVSAYRAALTVYTKEALPQDWAMTQSNLAEALFLSGQFEKAKDQLTIMLQYSDLDSEARVALLAIEVANFVALGLPKEVQHSFGTLQQALGEQVPDFSLTWSFSAIKPFIGQNQAFATHRSWLLVFIEHLEGTQRDEMLAAVNGARTESLKTPKP